MKRNPRKLAWTKAFRASHGKELTVDSTLTFAARRNAPVRYNRDLTAKTLSAMSIVSSIRAKRERRQYIHRMRGNKARSLAEDRELVAKTQHLLPPGLRTKALTSGGDKSVSIADGMVDDEEMDMRDGQVEDAAWRGYDSNDDAEDVEEEEQAERKRRDKKNGSMLKSAMAKKLRVDAMDIDD